MNANIQPLESIGTTQLSSWTFGVKWFLKGGVNSPVFFPGFNWHLLEGAGIYGCQPKNRGENPPKMDGENNGKP